MGSIQVVFILEKIRIMWESILPRSTYRRSVCVMSLGLSSLELQGICFRWHGSRRDVACDTCCAIMVWGDKILCSLIYILTAARPYPFGSRKSFFTISFPGWEWWWQHKVLRPWHLDSIGWNSTIFEKVPQASRYFVGSDYGLLFIFNWATYVFLFKSDNTENNYCSELLDMSLKSITWESGYLVAWKTLWSFQCWTIY